jgi:hypothetical protein
LLVALAQRPRRAVCLAHIAASYLALLTGLRLIEIDPLLQNVEDGLRPSIVRKMR